jgi:Ca2+/H+ antiporter
MISTVTVSTVSTVTTALAGSVALIGVVVLFILLLQKEVTTASDSSPLRRLGMALNIGIIPLLIAFVLIVIAKIVEVLR